MTIVIVPHPPISSYGPGLQITLSTSVSPVPAGFVWQLQFHPVANSSSLGWKENFPALQSSQIVTLGTTDQMQGHGTLDVQFKSDDSVNLVAFIGPIPGATVDTGTFTAPWNNQEGVGYQIALKPQATTGQGGFTETDRQTLNETANSSVLDQLVDSLTLQEVTSGPAGGRIDFNLAGVFWGVIVRISTLPDDLVPRTPDEDYFSPSLAVVRIYRGNDLWLRVPVHTTTRIIPLHGEAVAAAVVLAVTNTWMLNMHLQVNFLPGVLGQVFLMNFP